MIKVINKNELYHHGILKQKWGVRNGPPYPLDPEDHSAAEKKAGWRKSLNGGSGQKPKKKKIVKIADKLGKAIDSGTKNDKTSQKVSQEIDKFSNELGNELNKLFPKSESKKVGKKTEPNKIDKQAVEKHREDMLRVYKNNPEMKKHWEEASPEEVQKDIENKKKLARNIAIGVGVVGATAAFAIYYKNHQHKAIMAAQSIKPQDVKEGLVKPTDLMDKYNLSFDTANKIIDLKGKKGSDHLLNTEDTLAISKAVAQDFDFVLHEGTNLARVDFHKDFDLDKASKMLFLDPSEDDNKVYQKMLPNRTGLNDGRFNYVMEAVNEIKVPGYQNTRKIIQDMYKDPSFKQEIVKALAKMYSNNDLFNRDASMFELAAESEVNGAIRDGKEVYISLTALGAENQKLNDMVSQRFIKEGYKALMDFHDIEDSKTAQAQAVGFDVKLPMIMLDKNALKINSKTKIGNR